MGWDDAGGKNVDQLGKLRSFAVSTQQLPIWITNYLNANDVTESLCHISPHSLYIAIVSLSLSQYAVL